MDNSDSSKKEILERLEALESLVKGNLELNKKAIESIAYIKKYVFWRRVMLWVKITFVVTSLILIFIYLPPFLANAWESVQELATILTDTDKFLEAITNKQVK